MHPQRRSRQPAEEVKQFESFEELVNISVSVMHIIWKACGIADDIRFILSGVLSGCTWNFFSSVSENSS